MGFHFLPLLFVALFGTQGYASLLNKSPAFSTAPAFVWSSNNALQQADDTSSSKVIYEVRLIAVPADGCLHASGAQNFGVCPPRSSQVDQSAYVLQDVDTTALISNVWSALSRSPAVEANQQQSSADVLVVFVGNQVHILLCLLRTCLKHLSCQLPQASVRG